MCFFYVIVIKQIVKHIVKIGYQYAWWLGLPHRQGLGDFGKKLSQPLAMNVLICCNFPWQHAYISHLGLYIYILICIYIYMYICICVCMYMCNIQNVHISTSCTECTYIIYVYCIVCIESSHSLRTTQIYGFLNLPMVGSAVTKCIFMHQSEELSCDRERSSCGFASRVFSK